MSFDDILQLRAEPEFKSGRDASRGWIRNVSSKGWSDKELRQEIHHLLHQYREYMRIQKIKYSLTTLSCLAKLPAHIAGRLLLVYHQDQSHGGRVEGTRQRTGLHR